MNFFLKPKRNMRFREKIIQSFNTGFGSAINASFSGWPFYVSMRIRKSDWTISNLDLEVKR